MAKNKGGRRIGAIRGRTQFLLPNGHYAKRDRATGEILSIKADRKPYKNVVIEREPHPAPRPTILAARDIDGRISAHPISGQMSRNESRRPRTEASLPQPVSTGKGNHIQ